MYGSRKRKCLVLLPILIFSIFISFTFWQKNKILITHIKPRTDLKCSKWGITTSNLKEPSEGIRRFIYDPSWCIIVVRTESSVGYNIPSSIGSNIIVLDLEEQFLMKSKFINNLPKNEYSRRNVGYLYAIANGARLILDFEETSELKFWIPDAWSKEKYYSINDYVVPEELKWNVFSKQQKLSKCRTYNPYKNTKDRRLNKLFRIPATCKDFQMNVLSSTSHQMNERIGSIHSHSDHVEDTIVDEYPKTHPTKTFSTGGNLFPKGIFIPYGNEFSLYYPPGFWSLYVPSTLHPAKGNILRSYVSKTIHDLMDIRTGYTSRNLVWIRKNKLHVQDEPYAYSELIEQLTNDLESYSDKYYKRQPEEKVTDLILNIWNYVHEKGYISAGELESVKQWVLTLSGINNALSNNQYMKAGKDNTTTFWANSGKALTTNNVPSRCNDLKNYKYNTFWTSDIHDGCRMDFPTILSHLKQRVYVTGKRQKISYIDLFKYPGVLFSNNLSPIMKNVNHYNFPVTKEAIKINTEYYKEHPQKDVDGYYCEFPAALCEIWMPLNKFILFLTAHRYNIGRCSKESWNLLNNNLKHMLDTGNVVGALSRYDVEYMDHYTNLSPTLFPSYSGIYLKDYNYHPRVKYILYFGHVEILDYKSSNVKRQSIISTNTYKKDVLKSDKYTLESLVNSRAIIYMAYSVMSYKLTEFYTMGIPLFIPSIRYYRDVNKGFKDDRVTSTSHFYCANPSLNDFPSNPNSSHPFNPSLIHEEDVEAENYWLQYADFYDWPYIQHFDNISHLHYLIDTVDLNEIHKNMKKEVKIKRQLSLNSWCDAIMKLNLKKMKFS